MQALNNSLDNRQQNQCLNFIKCIACFLVVFIHIRFPSPFGNYVVALAKPGVAVFFVISGYYLYRPAWNEQKHACISKFKRLGKLTFKAFCVYFVWESFVRFVGTGMTSVISYWRNMIQLQNLFDLIVFNSEPVVGHLWFLLALLTAYLLCWLCSSLHLRIHWLAAFLLLEIHIFVMAASNMFHWGLPICWFRNVWFYGLPFVVLGMWIRTEQKRILGWLNLKVCISGIIIGILLTITEYVLLGSMQLYNGTVIIVIFAFLSSILLPDVLSKNIITKIGAKYSTEIYIYHYLVGEILDKIRRMFLYDYTKIASWFIPIITIILTILLIWLKNTIKNTIATKRVR